MRLSLPRRLSLICGKYATIKPLSTQLPAMSHHNHQRKTALVTGATSGIGLALSKVFAHEGYNVVLVARDSERLLARAKEINLTCGVSVSVIAADLSLPTGPIEVCRELEYHGVAVDVLVNNAGAVLHGYFAATDWQEEMAMISLNVLALTRLTKLLLPDMLSRGEGKILNVASTAAFQPGPLMAVYFASKAYVRSFSEALREELRGSGITVTTLCPGPTRTKLFTRANMRPAQKLSWPLQDPAAVARAGFDGLMRGKSVVIPGWWNKMSVLAVRCLPRAWVARASRVLSEPF